MVNTCISVDCRPSSVDIIGTLNCRQAGFHIIKFSFIEIIYFSFIFVFYIYTMKTFTNTIPDDLFELLDKKAKELTIPKNKIIEKAIRLYLEQLSKAEYIKSFKRMTQDEDIFSIAEEGMAEYFKQINDTDEAG